MCTKLDIPVFITTTCSMYLLVDYQSPRVSSTQQSPRVSSVQQSMFLSLGQYLCWWTISHRGNHPPSSQCFYHWINTSAGGLLVTEGIIRPVVSVSITGSIPLLVDYQSPRVSSVQQSVFLSLDQYICWWTISHRGYHPPSSQCFYHWINTSAGVDYQSPRVSSVHQSLFRH